MKIRKANIQDTYLLAQLEEKAFTVPWREESLIAEIQKQNSYYIVCEKEGKILGYAGMWILLDEGEIARIAVQPSFREKGIGTLLTEHLLYYAQSQNVQNVFLEVRESNIAARKIYQKAGFKEIGIRKKYYTLPTENAIIMQYNTVLL
jgi:ribosomal-protein-alanine N-acetyltransferase